ncbi:Amino-acid permease GAP1 [Dirofilaria immitis]
MFHKYRRRSVKKNFCGLTSFEKFTVGLLVASVQHIYKGPAGFHFLELRINVDVGVHTEKFLLKCMAHARKTITEKGFVIRFYRFWEDANQNLNIMNFKKCVSFPTHIMKFLYVDCGLGVLIPANFC